MDSEPTKTYIPSSAIPASQVGMQNIDCETCCRQHGRLGIVEVGALDSVTEEDGHEHRHRITILPLTQSRPTRPISSYPNPVPSHSIPLHSAPSHLIPSHPIQACTTQSHQTAIYSNPPNPISFHTTPLLIAQSHTTPQPHPTPPQPQPHSPTPPHSLTPSTQISTSAHSCRWA